jgi:Glycosyltransferase family 28 C-terminal domain
VLLVTGGSQGAVSLNRALAGAVSAIRNAGVQVLHVTGPKHVNEIQAPPGAVPYVAVPFVDRMDLAYAAADFALCRAGAMTCAELTAVGLPAAYVPLPHGNGEQRLNALPIVQRGGGLLVDDSELTSEWIKTSLLPVLTNIDQVAGMSEAAAAMGRKDADRWLAKAVIDAVAAETANRVAQTGREPAASRPPTPRPAQAPAPAGQWASPAAQPPPAPAQEEQPGSLFTPRTPRHQQGPGSAQQQDPGAPQWQENGQRTAGNEPGAGWSQGGPRSSSGGQGASWGQPAAADQRRARGQDARGPFEPGQFPAGQGQPGQLSTGQAPSARPPQLQSPQLQSPPVQPPQAQPLKGQPPLGRPPQARSLPSPSPSPGPGRHRQARS